MQTPPGLSPATLSASQPWLPSSHSCCVGECVGLLVGKSVGLLDGEPEGSELDSEGAADGKAEGTADGKPDGSELDSEGATDGEAEGTADGKLEGSAETEGLLDGAADGALPTVTSTSSSRIPELSCQRQYIPTCWPTHSAPSLTLKAPL